MTYGHIKARGESRLGEVRRCLNKIVYVNLVALREIAKKSLTCQGLRER